MPTKYISLLTGVIITLTLRVSGQSQLTPSPKTTLPNAAVTYTSTPKPNYGNQLPGASGAYTTPAVQQQTSPPIPANPPPFPAGPTYTVTPAKPPAFPPPGN